MLETILSGRYQIISQLGQGGFGQTYLAQDIHLPGKPQCVVKQLKPKTTDPVALQTAKRLFNTEAEVLYKLGTHNQIPQLFAHFEENQEFYLVQELIEGDSLTKEIGSGKQLPEPQVILLLQDILKVLEFVHQQQVIHRDLKPSNLIRRYSDGEVVLIDFGAVKQISATVLNPQNDTQGDTNLTIAIGSPGYMPNEQLAGTPQFSSDLYAVGMIGIEALTGLHPKQLQKDPITGEISWQHHIDVSSSFAYVLDKMIRYDFRQRYQSASEVLADLKNLSSYASGMFSATASRTNITQSSTAKWTHQDPTSPTVFVNRTSKAKTVNKPPSKAQVKINQEFEDKPLSPNHNSLLNTLKNNWIWGVMGVMLTLAIIQSYTFFQLSSLLTKESVSPNSLKSSKSASSPSPDVTHSSESASPVSPTGSDRLDPQTSQSQAIAIMILANSTQQFFYSEHKEFAAQWEELSLNKSAKTPDYDYQIIQTDSTMAITTATATNPQLKSYTGVVLKSGESMICETNQPSNIPPARPNVVGKTIQCPPGSSSVKLPN